MTEWINKIWKNEFFKGGIMITASSFIINILNYFFNFLIGRSLGPNGYGEIATMFSYITLSTIPLAVLSTLIIQKIGSTEKDKLSYAKSIEIYFYIKLKKLAPLFLILILFIPLIPRITNLSPLIGFSLVPFMVLSFLTSIYSSFLQGLKLFFYVSTLSVVIAILKFIGGAASLSSFGKVEFLLFFLFISSLTGYIGSLMIFQNIIKNNNSASYSKIENRLRHILLSQQFIITAFSVTAITALNNIDIIFVKKFFSAGDSGLYSSWSLFAKAILYVLGPILSTSYIFFTHSKSKDDQNKFFIYSLIGFAILGTASYIFYSLFAPLIINIFFGSKFSHIIPYLGFASIYGTLYAVIMFINNFFLARKQLSAIILAITLPIYIIGLIMIPKQLNYLYILNISYSFVLVIFYITAYLKTKNKL